mgnify:CR=1 FL=1
MNFIQRAAIKASSLLLKFTGIGFDPVSVAWYARHGYANLYQLLGGGAQSYTGKTINVGEALKCSTVWVCTRAITEAIASMPLPLLRRTSSGTQAAMDNPLYEILQKRPNEYQSAQRFRQVLTHHALNYGNGYARIARQSGGGKILALYLIHPTKIEPKQADDGTISYLLGDNTRLNASEVFHLQNMSDDGVTGMGIVAAAKQAIGLSLALEEYGARFFARGGMPAGALKKTIPFSDDEARKTFREDFDKVYGSIENAHKSVLLEGEWDFKPFGVDPEKAQFTLARQFMIAEICRYYAISPHLAADLSRATFSNIEHLALEFIQHTLLPWMTLWEQAIYNRLLTDQERADGYFAKHNASALMRGDFATRMAGFATLLQNGIVSINEVRDLEDWDPVEGGDSHHIQLNMQTVPGTGEPTSSEAAKTQQGGLVKVSDGTKKSWVN